MVGVSKLSIIVKGSVIIALLFVIVDAILVTSSYTNQKKAYFDELKRTGGMLEKQMEVVLPAVVEAKTSVAAGKKNDAPVLEELLVRLNAMIDNEYVANAFFFLPEPLEKDGEQSLVLIQFNNALHEAGYYPGISYSPTKPFMESFLEAVEKGAALTDVYTDENGAWITQLNLMRDGDGKPVAVFGVDFNYGNVTAKLNRMLWNNIAVSAAVAFFAILIGIAALRQLVKPLKHLILLSAQAAKGDLTVSIPVRSRDEIGALSTAFNDMILSLRKLTQSVSATASDVGGAVRMLEAKAGETASATKEAGEAMRELAAGTSIQLQSSRECRSAVAEISVGIQRVAEFSSVVADLAVQTSGSAEEGMGWVERFSEQMLAIQVDLTAVVGTVKALNDDSGRIGQILALIAEVATQTNLLSLNASIEAARAGEAGRGFAIVAAEIRKLAELSEQSSQQIGQILESIGIGTAKASEELERTALAVRQGSETAERSGETFSKIVDSTLSVSSQIQEISSASEQMSAGSEQIAASLDELEQIAMRSSEHTGRMSELSESQSELVDTVGSLTELLRRGFEELTAHVGKFKV
ncbi:methyl-accepting chemotaxis protein [Cohnella sp.]|uniref:methyl-accepting chemotaxis protein n=1 Tax=Cohnella sp. TaxID=1883426 RepID=UPI00356208F6